MHGLLSLICEKNGYDYCEDCENTVQSLAMKEEPRRPGRPPIDPELEAEIERKLRGGETPQAVIAGTEGARTSKVYEIDRRIRAEKREASA